MLTRGVGPLSLRLEIRLCLRSHHGRERIGPVAYCLVLPKELSRVHNVFHVCNLKKCLSDDTLVIPLEEIQLDDKLNFVEEPIEIIDREVKQLKRSRIPIIKVRWMLVGGPSTLGIAEDHSGTNYPSSPQISQSTPQIRSIDLRRKAITWVGLYTSKNLGIPYSDLVALIFSLIVRNESLANQYREYKVEANTPIELYENQKDSNLQSSRS
ncbi:hypothetical protein Tco_0045729 [Tanacetum coccineum]